VQNVNELRDRIVRAARCVANEMATSTCPQTEYHLDVCHATNGAHIEMYLAHKELYDIQCSKMYRLLQHTWCLKIHSVSFCCRFMPDTC